MFSGTLLFVVCSTWFALGTCVPGEKRLHGDILAGYNKNVRPVTNESDSVHASIGVAVIDFSLDSQTDILESLLWLRLAWTDMYLRWKPDEYDNIDLSRFNPDMIWKPDICLYNSWDHSCEVTEDTHTSAMVSSDGEVMWVPPVRLSSRCELDRRNWPRDEATCLLKFGSWTHDGRLLNLTMRSTDGPDMTDVKPNLHWQVFNWSAELDVKYYTCCPEPYQSVLYTIRMRRNEQRVAELVMPVVCAAVLMLLSFLVSVTSPQKLTFCWVSVLISILGLLNMFSHLPPDAHGTATIATFYVTFVVLLLLFTGLEVLVMCLSRPRSAPLPRFVRSCLSGLVGKLLCLETPVFHDYSPEDNEMLDSSPEGEFQKVTRDGSKSYEWAILAGAVDRVCGLVFLFILAVLVPPNLTWAD